ncbi:MAG TPA: hypothetical protein VGS11_11095, partial [Candidatus Bathyarchaeia archaeon]|nr:hypothetical protein [Candidatus Bathyarchaeia archaeon]
FYYSDSNSKIPVRDITRFGDSKSDPNVETGTYGLFSTCEEDMRRSFVQKGLEHIFFFTTRTRAKTRVRVLTGYYHIRWYHRGPDLRHHAGKADYWLAADEVRFLSRGFPLEDLTGYLRGLRLDRRFRRYLYLYPETTQLLLSLMREARDATQEFVREVKRLENENLQKHGLTYTNWNKKEGFDWNWARKYLGKQ